MVEIAVVTTLIGLLATLALPSIERVIIRTQVASVENDLRVFSAGFKLHMAETGVWAQSQADPAELPAGLDGFVGERAWTRQTPLGGHYRWERDGTIRGVRFRAAILVASADDSAVHANYDQLVRLDAELDDGNLLTGRLQIGAYPQILYVLE